MTYVAGLLAVIAAPDEVAKAGLLATLAPPAAEESWPPPTLPARPGRPADWIEGEAPRRRRSMANPVERCRFLHTIFQIELSAVDLACALCLRGGGAPTALHVDFLRVAAEECQHAALLRTLLEADGYPPGTDPVHYKLWEAGLACADLGEQLVVIPRFLEARGLDVNAALLPRMAPIHAASHQVLARIYQDEIGHVGIGTRWHQWWCVQAGLDPIAHFSDVVERHFGHSLPSPFALDRPGRIAAGFVADELAMLERPRPRPLRDGQALHAHQ